MEIFIYEGNELAIIKKDDDIWFRAKTVANILKYSNQRKAIIDHVDSEDKCSLNELKFRGNSSRGDGVTSAFSKLRPIWISHMYYFFPKMGKLK